MICPYCKNEMEKGYIQSRDGLGWNKKKRIISAFSGWSADERLLPEQVAYRCEGRKIIIIDYSVVEE